MYKRFAAMFVAALIGSNAAMAGTCSDGFTLPPTAQSTFHADGTLEITVGAPWMAVDPGGSPGLSLTQNCDCTSGSSGCSPVVYGDRSGCEQGSCTTCTGTRTGVVLDMDGVRVVGSSETDQLDLIDAERALEIPWVAAEVDLFVDDLRQGMAPPPVQPEADAPAGWSFVLVSAYGHHLQVLAPDLDNSFEGARAAKGSCSCSKGSGCTYKNLGLGAWTCERNGCSGTCGATSSSYHVLASSGAP